MSLSAHMLPFRGGSSAAFQYRLSTANAPPPSSGQAMTNTTDPAAATRIFLSYFNVAGEVIAPLLRVIYSGQTLIIQDTANVAQHAEFTVAADAIDHEPEGYVEFAVIGGTSSVPGKNNQRITIFPTSNRPRSARPPS